MINERVKSIAVHYGLAHQLLKLREECQELIEAIDGHFKEHTPNSKNHVKEEMADVSLVTDQIRWLFDCSDIEWEMRKDFKTNRTIYRMIRECQHSKSSQTSV